MDYPFENLFRRPYEAVSATAALVAIGIMWSFQGLLLITPLTGGVLTIGLMLLAIVRARQANYLIRFQRNLRRLPVYELTADEIPVSSRELFMGKGFRWTQQHAQRLAMARLPRYKHLLAHNARYHWARDFERQHPGSWLARQLRKQAWWNPVAPLPPVGGDPAIHGVEPNEHDVYSDLGERVGHTIVLGTTRVGKTRFCELLVTQDIRRGDVVIVFDPKGDVELLMRMYAEARRAGREKEFYFFHLGYPDVSARYSPVATFSRVTEVATRIAGQLPSEGQSAAFREFVWRFVNVMARAMVALGMKPSYEQIYQNAVNIDDLCLKYFEYWLNRDHPGWDGMLPEADKMLQEQARKTGRAMYPLQILALIRKQGWHDQIADGLASVLANGSYFEKLVSSLYPLLEKLTTGAVSELLSPNYEDPNDPRPIFDWPKIIDTGGIVYVGLDALSDFEVAGAVGNSMFADLTSLAGRQYKYGGGYGQSGRGRARKVCLHADEFNELVGDEFIPMVNKAGGAGYQVTAYTQTGTDLEAKIGSKAKSEQIFGNFNTLVILRVKNLATAEILTNQLPQVQIDRLIPESRTGDSTDSDLTDFTSGASDKLTSYQAPLVEPSDLVQLPKGQAFALIEGGQLYKIRLPLASRAHDAMMPSNLVDVVASMRRRYDRYAAAVDAGLIEGLDSAAFAFDSWRQGIAAGMQGTQGRQGGQEGLGLAGEPLSVTVEGKGSGF